MKIVAIKERAKGNESVGTEWVEVKIFDALTPISEVVKWNAQHEGRLMITIAEEETFNTKEK